MFKSIFRNRTTRTLLIFFLVIISFSAFFLVFGYRNELKILENQQMERLHAIAATIGNQLNGDEHELMVKTMMESEEHAFPFQNTYYVKLNHQLAVTQKVNKVQTPIYTLFYHPDRKVFCYGVRSDTNFNLFEEYRKFPKDLILKMNKGGTLPKYKSENGTWISAFHPVRNSKQQVVALIEVDEEFSTFLQSANKQLYRFLGAGMGGIVLISALLFPILQKIIQRDTKLFDNLATQKMELEQFNTDMSASIQYASCLQRVLMPEPEDLQHQLTNAFIFFQPKDIISGDFYWSYETENAYYIALADGSGHGIPGAMMSVMGIMVLNSLMESNPDIELHELLMKLDQEIVRLMSSTNRAHTRSDGMDIGVCKIIKKDKSVSFSGALINLYCVSDEGEWTELKGQRFPIGGGKLYEKTTIETIRIENSFKGTFYLFSDGFQDQFGGADGKKYGKKQLLNLLSEIHQLSSDEQLNRLTTEFKEWSKNLEQVDDVSVMGFRL